MRAEMTGVVGNEWWWVNGQSGALLQLLKSWPWSDNGGGWLGHETHDITRSLQSRNLLT